MTKPGLAFLLLAACGTTDPDATVFAPGLAMPADLALADGELISVQYDGSVRAFPVDGGDPRVIVPPAREVAANEIPVELSGYNVEVAPGVVAWTSQASGRAELWRAARDGTGATKLDDQPSPIFDVVAAGDRWCWASDARVACADLDGQHVTTLAEHRHRPQALVAAGDTLYWAEAGEPAGTANGAIIAVPIGGGAPRTVVDGVADPRALAVLADRLYWLDGGTCTRTGNLCTGNHDARLASVGLIDGVVLIDDGGHVQVGDGLALVDDELYFTADSALRENGNGIAHDGVVTRATSMDDCTALAADPTRVFCATLFVGQGAITAVAR